MIRGRKKRGSNFCSTSLSNASTRACPDDCTDGQLLGQDSILNADYKVPAERTFAVVLTTERTTRVLSSSKQPQNTEARVDFGWATSMFHCDLWFCGPELEPLQCRIRICGNGVGRGEKQKNVTVALGSSLQVADCPAPILSTIRGQKSQVGFRLSPGSRSRLTPASYHGRPLAIINIDHQSLTRLGSSLPTTTMSLEAARDLSIQDLLRVLNEKLGLECTRIRDIPLSRTVPATFLESEVSTRWLILVPTDATAGSDSSGLYRSTFSRPEHTIF